MLNWIWAGFFLVAFVAGLFRWLIIGEPGVWAAMVASTFDMAKTGFEVSLGLIGIMCLWLGIMRLGEKGGAVELLARGFDPLLRRLFPGVPAGHPAGASVVMNRRCPRFSRRRRIAPTRGSQSRRTCGDRPPGCGITHTRISSNRGNCGDTEAPRLKKP